MDLITYVSKLNPAVLSMPIMGHLNTYDVHNRTVTVSGSPELQSYSDNGFGFNPKTDGRYTIADGPEQNFVDQTVFVYFSKPIISDTTDQYVILKYVSTRNWYLRLFNNLFRVYNSAAASTTCTISPVDKVSVAFRSTGSSKIDFFFDGIFVEQGAGLDFSSQPDEAITIGATAAGTSPSLNPIAVVSTFSSALTNEQIGLIHNYSTEIKHTYLPKIISFIPEKDTKGAVINIWGDPNSNGVISDKSGNGNDGTLAGSISVINDGVDEKLSFLGRGQGRVIVSSSASIDNLSAHTYQFHMNQNSAGEANFGRIFSKGDKQALYNSGVNYNYAVDYSDGFGIWTFPVYLNSDLFIQLQHTHSDATDLPVCYINGVEVTVSVNVAKTGSKDSDSGLDLLLGNRVALDRSSDMLFDNFKYFPTKLSTENVRDEYVKFTSGHRRDFNSRFKYPDSLGLVSAPAQVGPWNTWNSSHSWSDDGVDRCIYHSALSGYASIEHPQAYGAWYSRVRYTNSTNFRGSLLIISNIKDKSYADASARGYLLYINHRFGRRVSLFRLDGGIPPTIDDTGVNWLHPYGQTVEAFMVRRLYDGRFTVWLRDGDHPTWTQAFQIVDNTYASEIKYLMQYAIEADMHVYDVSAWTVGDSLTPDDLPELNTHIVYNRKNQVNVTGSREEYAVTPSPVSAPNYVGPWYIHSASGEWLDNGSERYIERTTTYSYTSLEYSQVYGAWYFKIYRDTGADMWIFLNAALPNVAFDTAGQYGYAIRIYNGDRKFRIYRINNGAVGSLYTSPSDWYPNADEDIEFFISRDRDTNNFFIFTRESAHTTWTRVHVWNDSVITEGYPYVYFYQRNATTVRFYHDFRHWPRGYFLHPNHIPDIAD